MRDPDRGKFFEVLQGVHDFYGREMSVFAGQVWWQACAGFELERVTKAFSGHLMDAERGQFMPKPADIVRLLDGTRTDRSLIAWGKVFDAMRSVGAYQSVAFDDAAIHAAVEDCGGWTQMCRGKLDELPFLQKRFCDAYRAYVARGGFPYPAKLLGEHEASNRLRGHQTAPPVLIGDRGAAQRVIERGGTPKAAVSVAVAQVLPAVQVGEAA